jgi:hypothetical protein
VLELDVMGKTPYAGIGYGVSAARATAYDVGQVRPVEQ